MASGVLFVLGRPLGFYLYAATFIFTVIWSFWEVDLSPWALTPRLAGPFILMIVALALLPALPIRGADQIRSYGFAGLGVFAVALVVAIYARHRADTAAALPRQEASSLYDDAANAPLRGEWNAYGGGPECATILRLGADHAGER